jgi:hypothetical protein
MLLGVVAMTVARGLQGNFVMIVGRPHGMQAGANQSIWTIDGVNNQQINGETRTSELAAGAAQTT